MKYNENQLKAINHFEGNCCLLASAGSGKALKNGTQVMTMGGGINIEDLNVGDFVLSYDGTECNVIGVFPQGKKQVYEVEFSDGSIVECCGEHLWRYQTSYMRDRKKWDTQQIKYLFENIPLKIKSGKFNKANLYIPMTEPIQYPKKYLPIHPYLLGVMLGDGTLLKSFQKLTNSEKDITERVDLLLNDIGYELKQSCNNKIEYSIKIKDAEINFQKKSYFSQALFDLGLLEKHSYDKFIPKIYLHSCIEDRLELLKGLIDTDGYKANSYYEFSSASERLAKDVKYLCESLGLTAKLSIKENVTYTYKDNKLNGRISYRLFIKTSKLFDRLHNSKKHELKYTKPQGYARRSIVDIRLTDRFEEMTCISVNGKDNLFLIDNFIVTHNTSVLVERIKNLVNVNNVKQHNILAITFSKKAADNMSDRLGKEYEYVNIMTFHALGYRMLKEQKVIPPWDVMIKDWEVNKIIEDICVGMGLVFDVRDVQVKDIQSYISTQKNNLIRVTDEQIKTSTMPHSFEAMCNIYIEYERNKNLKKKIDFDDMILKTYYLLLENKDVRKYYESIYPFILVDETQDTNKSQYEILKLLAGNNNNLFVVGDALQNIFSWRGCDNSYFMNFYKHWKDTTVISLNTNYRSTDNIVKYANKLVKGIPETEHQYYQESKAFKKKYKNPEYKLYDNPFMEALMISGTIKDMTSDKQYKYKDFAILTRTNAQLQEFEHALFYNKIPYINVNGFSFYDKKEIRCLLSYLRLVDNPDNDVAFRDIYNVPNRYLGKVFMDEINDFASRNKCSLFKSSALFHRSNEWRYKTGVNELIGIIANLKKQDLDESVKNVGEIVKYLRRITGYDKFMTKDSESSDTIDNKIDNINQFEKFCEDYKDISSLLKKIDEIIAFSNKDDKDSNKVVLMTIHRSKGLEYPVIFLPSINQGILPHGKTNDKNEELRLLYVGMTRAEKELYISSVECNRSGNLQQSEFLDKIFTKKQLNPNDYGNKVTI